MFERGANVFFNEYVKHKLGKTLCILTLLVLTGASQAGTLSIKSAERWGDTLYLQLNFAPNSDVLEALDASVPLKFILRQRRSGSILVQNFAEQTVVLAYAPLLERFELISNKTVKPYRLRAELLDAFSNMQLPAPRGDDGPNADTQAAIEVRLSLSIGALPAPLRLPALLDSDWWLDSGWVKIAQGEKLSGDATPDASTSDVASADQ